MVMRFGGEPPDGDVEAKRGRRDMDVMRGVGGGIAKAGFEVVVAAAAGIGDLERAGGCGASFGELVLGIFEERNGAEIGDQIFDHFVGDGCEGGDFFTVAAVVGPAVKMAVEDHEAVDVIPAGRDLERRAGSGIAMLAGGVDDVDAQAGKRAGEVFENFGGVLDLLGAIEMAECFGAILDHGEAAVEGGVGEVNGEFGGESPGAEADEDKNQAERENADQAIDKEQTVANAPEAVALKEAEAAEEQDAGEG